MIFEHITPSEKGIECSRAINELFDDLYVGLHHMIPDGRERALMVTKLQEARDVAVRAMLTSSQNKVEG